MGGWWSWALVSPDGVAPSRMVGVSASVDLPLHHKVQKFSSGTGSPGWSRKKGRKTVVLMWWWCAVVRYESHVTLTIQALSNSFSHFGLSTKVVIIVDARNILDVYTLRCGAQ